MNRWSLLVLFVLSLFAIQPLSAERGEWLEQWKSIKNEYEDTVGDTRPREAFLGIVKTAKISPSLNKMDHLYKDLTQSEGKVFRKKFKAFKKAFKKFTKKKDSNMNFLEDDRLTKSVSRAQKKAAKKLQKETDELEKEIREFVSEINEDKQENAVITFDLIECDKETATLIEPEGIISVRCTLSDKAMQEYENIISKKVKKKLRKIKTELEAKLIELDNKFLDEIIDLIENEQIQSKGQEHLASAQELWDQAKQKAEAEVQDVVNQEWIKIRQAKVRYRKYKIEAAKSIGKKLFALGSAIGRLVASNGADVTAYISIAKTTIQLAREIKDLMEEPEKVSERLAKEVAAYNALHAELLQTPDTVKQLKLAKEESSIRKDLLALKNKAAGLVDKAANLGKKIDDLEIAKTEMEKIEDVNEVGKLQEKIAAADLKIKELDEKHNDILGRLEKAEEVIETSESAFDNQEPAKLLVAKEKLEEALEKFKKVKTACEKMYELAETVGVF